MRKLYRVNLTPEERNLLNLVISKGKHSAQKIRRANILLKADESEHRNFWKDKKIAETFHARVRTIEKIRKQFVEEGFEATLSRKQYKKRESIKITGEVEAHLISLKCSDPPKGYAKWTLRLLANKMVELNYIESMSHESVRRILKKTI